MFSPTFATYRVNATDDEHMSRVVMAWSITNKTVQPVFIAAGFLAAVTSARISLIVLAVVLLPGIAFLPWRADAAEAQPMIARAVMGCGVRGVSGTSGSRELPCGR